MNTIEQINQHVTPFKQLVSALIISNASVTIALIPPVMILLTLKLNTIGAKNVADALAMVTGMGAFVALIMNPVAGAIADRTSFKFGRRRTWILVGSLLGGIALLGIGLATEIWQIILLWSLAQVFFNFQLSSNNALVAEQVENTRRGSVSGLIGAVPTVAPLIGLGLINIMSDQSEMAKWTVLAIISVIGATLAVLLIHEIPGVYFYKKENFDEKRSFWRVIPNPREYPAFALTWLTRFLVLSCTPASLFTSLFLIQRFNYSTTELSSRIMIISITSTSIVLVFSVVGGVVSDRLKRQKPFVIGAAILMGLSLIVQSFAQNFAVILFSTILMAIGSGLYFSVDIALQTRVLPDQKSVAKDLGIFNMAKALPQFIIPAMAPFLLGIGGYELFFILIGLLGILGAVTVLGVPEMAHRENKMR